MKATAKKKVLRRQPVQRRSRQTVEVVLDAVVEVLKRHGLDGVTTNRIAEAAGVSIGSVYQYFPDKRAIFAALHDRHVQEIGRIVESRLLEHATSPLDVFVRALLEALIDAHAVDVPARPKGAGITRQVHELMTTTVPHGAEGARPLAERLRGIFELALASRTKRRPPGDDLDRTLFVLPVLVEALAHGAAYSRPPGLSLSAAKEEAVRAVLAYLRTSA